jgi:hypothetical protein
MLLPELTPQLVEGMLKLGIIMMTLSLTLFLTMNIIDRFGDPCDCGTGSGSREGRGTQGAGGGIRGLPM